MPLQPYLSSQLVEILGQARRALEPLDEGVFRASPQPMASSSIGEHVRHVLDAIQCFVNGVGAGEVDFDRRERDERTEREISCALERIDGLCRSVAALAPNDRIQVGSTLISFQDDKPHPLIGREISGVPSMHPPSMQSAASAQRLPASAPELAAHMVM